MEQTDIKIKTDRSLRRLMPKVDQLFQGAALSDKDDRDLFKARLETHFPELFELYYRLYAGQYDFLFHLEELLLTLAKSWISRSSELKRLDEEREAHPLWFQSQRMLGGVCYVDRFGDNLSGIRERIPYFKELGLTYLHLMPLFAAPEGDNDGGYAVSSYRDVTPALGTIEELSSLATELRREGISLVLDFVFNHTSNEHRWAMQALQGDLDFQEYYRMYPDRLMPDAYEQNLREIFPGEHPGAFTYQPEMRLWVWTTFHSYQWDLNYNNPVVFNRMAEEMLFLANVGVEVLRLDAVAFIWKKLGTGCENLPEAHYLIQAFNQAARIAAPALTFKSEAIVHPDEVVRYIGPNECQLSYNPLLMALLWNSLATRDVRLLRISLHERFNINPECAWVNYVRCHDDIGWTFSDEDAARLGINGFDHRLFLNSFYTGRFPGSFARGLPFQENPRTGDARISGTCASLAGLEKALREETEHEVELAVRRILLIHAVIMTIGGIPLIYLGDEIGVLNDYSFHDDPDLAGDTRWVHRPKIDWQRMALRDKPGELEQRIMRGFKELIALRTSNPVFQGNEMEAINLNNDQVLAYLRSSNGQRAMFIGNFSEQEQLIPLNELRLVLHGYHVTEAISGTAQPLADLHLAPYEFRILIPGV